MLYISSSINAMGMQTLTDTTWTYTMLAMYFSVSACSGGQDCEAQLSCPHLHVEGVAAARPFSVNKWLSSTQTRVSAHAQTRDLRSQRHLS